VIDMLPQESLRRGGYDKCRRFVRLESLVIIMVCGRQVVKEWEVAVGFKS
jgi:hypothetical protein